MRDVVDFYNLISPLVLHHRFCVDPDIPVNTMKHHPPCTKDFMKRGIVAGIRRNGNTIEPFLSKDQPVKSVPKNYLFLEILLILMIFIVLKFLLQEFISKLVYNSCGL